MVQREYMPKGGHYCWNTPERAHGLVGADTRGNLLALHEQVLRAPELCLVQTDIFFKNKIPTRFQGPSSKQQQKSKMSQKPFIMK